MLQKLVRGVLRPRLPSVVARAAPQQQNGVKALDPRRLRDPRSVRTVEEEVDDATRYQSAEEEATDVADAIKNGSLGFGFSAGGLLFPYYIGVMDELKSAGIMTDATRVAGASAGSLIAACIHCGLTTEQVTKACLVLADDCRRNGTRARLGQVLLRFLQHQQRHSMDTPIHFLGSCFSIIFPERGSPGNFYMKDLLPPDAHERCGDRTFVAVTRVLPRPRGYLISDFKSKDDLIAALMTSCHIPYWFDGSLVSGFRGSLHYDGGLTNFLPVPPEVEHAVGVCCFPSRQVLASFPGTVISPDTYDDTWDVALSELLRWAFQPAEEERLLSLIDKGRADARAWAEQSSAVEAAQALRAAA